MPVQIADPRAAARLEEALRSENPGTLTDFELVVTGEDRTEDLDECEIEAADGPGISLDASLGIQLVDSAVSGSVYLDCIAVGVRVRRFAGSVWFSNPSPGQTDILCHTGGFWLDRLEVGQVYEPLGAAPSTVLREMLSRTPYESGLVDVAEIPRPLFTRDKFEGFRESNKLSEVIEALNAEVPIFVRDLPSGGVKAGREQLIPSDTAVWEFVVGRDLDREDFSAEREEDLYFDVAVYRQDDSVETELARVAVPDSKAPKGATLKLESSDTSEKAIENALQDAHDAAYSLWRGVWKVTAKLPWIHPLLLRGDTVAFVVAEGGVEKRFHTLLGSVKDYYPVLGQDLGGSSVLQRVTRVEPEPEPLRRGGKAVVVPRAGYDWLSRPYVSTSLSWASVDGTTGELLLDPDAAAREGITITEEADGAVVISG